MISSNIFQIYFFNIDFLYSIKILIIGNYTHCPKNLQRRISGSLVKYMFLLHNILKNN